MVVDPVVAPRNGVARDRWVLSTTWLTWYWWVASDANSIHCPTWSALVKAVPAPTTAVALAVSATVPAAAVVPPRVLSTP